MTEPRSDRELAQESADRHPDPHAEAVQYPEDHVVGTLDMPEQAAAALHALSGGGFLESEITVACGADAADRVQASSSGTSTCGPDGLSPLLGPRRVDGWAARL